MNIRTRPLPQKCAETFKPSEGAQQKRSRFTTERIVSWGEMEGQGRPATSGWWASGVDLCCQNGFQMRPEKNAWCIQYKENLLYHALNHQNSIKCVSPCHRWLFWGRVRTNLCSKRCIIRIDYFGGTNDTQLTSFITGRQTADISGRAVYRNMTDFNARWARTSPQTTPLLSWSG